MRQNGDGGAVRVSVIGERRPGVHANDEVVFERRVQGGLGVNAEVPALFVEGGDQGSGSEEATRKVVEGFPSSAIFCWWWW